MIPVIERARRYIAKCPVAVSGQRGHDATFHVASVLVWGFALPDSEAFELLREWNRSCLPPWAESDLVHKVRSAANAQHALARGHLLGDASSEGVPTSSARAIAVQSVSKPKFCPMILKRVAAKVTIPNVVAAIGATSPVQVDRQDSASVLRWLYGKNVGERILIFSEMKSQGQFVWETERNAEIQNRDLPRGADGIWFLPQPVDGNFHPNPRLDGKLSRRSEESVTAWRYVVLESDEADADDWLRCLVQMPLPISCICSSGGRSIHALVRIDAATKSDWDSIVKKMKPVLVTLGADPGALSAVRLTRLPQAMRWERVQQLMYLNPKPTCVPIVEQGARVGLYSGEVRHE
ncbi:MAG: hypothetical protein ACXWBP_04645 [Limisphaerales bacterium]